MSGDKLLDMECCSQDSLTNAAAARQQSQGSTKRQLPENAMTDPNSLYRKLYNRDMQFFLWVIE